MLSKAALDGVIARNAPGSASSVDQPVRRPDLVSVVVPARDAAATVAAQLDALARQDYPDPWELVVVDNGSRDTTDAVAWARIEAGFPVPARVVRAEGQVGAAFARNHGARLTAGDLLAFCDADDLVADDWLHRLVDAAGTLDAVGARVEFDRLNDGPARRSLALGADRAESDAAGSEPSEVSSPRFRPVLSSGGMAVWRDVFERVGGFDVTYVGGGEDKDLSYRLVGAGARVGFAPGAVVHGRLRATMRARMVQAFERGVQDPHLYRAHADEGYPPRGVGVFLRTVLGLLRDLPLLVDPAGRDWWCVRVAREAGRVVGSIRYRTVHL